ncbi:MAG TPA: histidine kinase [Epulopiscium sp.]|nr:histidine kinase [Candidatus Epulonipiscium sp.]
MKKHNKSLVTRITIGTVVLLVISLVVLITNYLYSVYVLKNNIISSKSNMLNIYINNMDNILSNAERDLDDIVTNIGDFSDLANEDEATRYFLSIKTLDIITNRISSNRNSDALIVYNKESDTYLAAYSNQMSVNNKWDLVELAKLDDIKNHIRKMVWSIARMNENVYFYKAYTLASTRVISIVTPKKLMSLIDTTISDPGLLILTDQLGEKIISDGITDYDDMDAAIPNNASVVKNYKGKYMIVSSQLQKAEARLSAVLGRTNILLGLSLIQWTIILLGGLFLMTMPFIINYLNKEIIKPINRLITGIGEVEQGNLEYHVEIHEESKEEIRTYIDALVVHFRYVLKGTMTQVTIDDEINHIKNYIAMQEIRFPGSIFYVVDLDQDIKIMQVPQLLMLTVVENAFKHAMTLDDTLSIFIKIGKVIHHEEETIQIIIEDNGEGFPEETIEKVNNDCLEDTQDGSKIGISNIKKTLKLLYGNKGSLRISNVEPCGAKISIILPIEVNENETDHN